MSVSITKGLVVLTAVVLVLGAVGRTSGEIIIDQNTTINYTTEEDVHIVQGAGSDRRNSPPHKCRGQTDKDLYLGIALQVIS